MPAYVLTRRTPSFICRVMVPRIGITTDFVPRDSAPDKGRSQLEQEYAETVASAGGRPVALPVMPPEYAAAYVDDVDGLIFTGGLDLPPSLYGEDPHPKTKLLPQRRVDWDLALLRAALAARRPILAICLGVQELNIALGGSLQQHLETGLRHARDESGHAYHPVQMVEPGSRLREIVGADTFETNSSHHQAVARLGKGLRVTARAPDGTVEGLEPDRDQGFVVGVQWHPERIADRPEHHALFEALVGAARSGAA